MCLLWYTVGSLLVAPSLSNACDFDNEGAIFSRVHLRGLKCSILTIFETVKDCWTGVRVEIPAMYYGATLGKW